LSAAKAFSLAVGLAKSRVRVIASKDHAELLVAQGVSVSRSAPEQVLEAVRRVEPGGLRELPAVFCVPRG
jgi:hypothetical protein